MVRRLRRLLLLAALLGAAAALIRRQTAARTAEVPSAPPRWPPIEVDRPAPDPAVSTPEASGTTPWRAPVDGACPPGYPVKANDRSRIFHVSGGRSYDRTVPERCYANADDALADGYRAAKA
jgi:large subunit ribosomal protein L17